MVTASLAGVETVVIDEFDGLEVALASLRGTWQEDDGFSPIVVRGDDGAVLATLVPVKSGWELLDADRLCLTVYPDGRTERHWCEYVLDADGCYLSTNVALA